MITSKIEQLLKDKFQEEEFIDCFIVEIKFNEKNNKLEVFVDSDSSMDFSKCRRISRYLESYIDEEGWLGEKYTLEVSSPGISRPLKLVRQYKKNIGRTLNLILTPDNSKEKGKLIIVTDEAITIEQEVKIKQGKKKRTEIHQKEIHYDQIKKAVVQISFK